MLKGPGGNPLPRQPNNPPPCRPMRGRKLIGCPKGTPEEPRSLSRKNQAAYWHWQQCSAIGSFPDDPIVRQNAAVIQQAERLVDTLNAWQIKRGLALLHETTLAVNGLH